MSATKSLLLDAVTPTWQDQLSLERAAQFERFAELVCVARALPVHLSRNLRAASRLAERPEEP